MAPGDQKSLWIRNMAVLWADCWREALLNITSRRCRELDAKPPLPHHEEFVLVLVNMPRELAGLAQWAIHRCDEPELVDRACFVVIC